MFENVRNAFKKWIQIPTDWKTENESVRVMEKNVSGLGCEIPFRICAKYHRANSSKLEKFKIIMYVRITYLEDMGWGCDVDLMAGRRWMGDILLWQSYL